MADAPQRRVGAELRRIGEEIGISAQSLADEFGSPPRSRRANPRARVLFPRSPARPWSELGTPNRWRQAFSRVADRWCLWHNLFGHVEDAVIGHHRGIKESHSRPWARVSHFSFASLIAFAASRRSASILTSGWRNLDRRHQVSYALRSAWLSCHDGPRDDVEERFRTPYEVRGSATGLLIGESRSDGRSGEEPGRNADDQRVQQRCGQDDGEVRGR